MELLKMSTKAVAPPSEEPKICPHCDVESLADCKHPSPECIPTELPEDCIGCPFIAEGSCNGGHPDNCEISREAAIDKALGHGMNR